MMNWKYLSPLLLAVACTSRVDTRAGEGEQVVIVYGHVTTDTLAHAITLSRSTGYFATAPPGTITGAVVTISCGAEVYPLAEDDALPGTYHLVHPLAGVPGRSYTLTVEEESGVYRATSLMPLTSEIDSIELRPSPVFKNQIEVLGHGTLPANERNFLSFHLYRNGIHVTAGLEDLFIVDDTYFQQREMRGVLCQLLDQGRQESALLPGDTVTLRVDVLPGEYARFLQQARQQARGANPIFGGQPANISTNIERVSPDGTTRVAGFFAAFATGWKSAVYLP